MLGLLPVFCQGLQRMKFGGLVGFLGVGVFLAYVRGSGVRWLRLSRA